MATKTTKNTTSAKNTAAQAKQKASASVASAKKAVKNVNVSSFFASVGNFFQNLDKAYYVAFLAIVGTILFFMPWLNITVLSKLYATLGINFLSGVFAIPQTLLSIFFSVDTQITGLNAIVDKFATINDNLNSLHDVTQYINTLCSILGINVAANGETVNGIIAAIQNALPSPEQLVLAKQALAGVGSAVKGASAAVTIWVLIVVGFNAYAAIVCIAKKRITKGCMAAFIIEGVFVVIFMIICLAVSSVVQSLVFFLPNIFEATGWAWLTLIVCIVGIVLCAKYQTKKPAKK